MTDEPAPNTQSEESLQSRFLDAFLSDHERSQLQATEHYVAQFPEIADFVRSEYDALTAMGAEDEKGRTQCGRYQILSLIGEGGMSWVHEALDPKLGRRVVIKTLRRHGKKNSEASERLKREARVLAGLSHPDIAKVLELIEEDGQVNVVMPLYQGRSLAACIDAARAQSGDADPPYPTLEQPPAEPGNELRNLIMFFIRTARAVHAAHEAGVIHRDLKPQNIMVSPDGSPVVLDFGLALVEADERLTQEGDRLGTPLYMAPEQFTGGESNRRTDVYGLGVTLYEALALVHPFAGSGGREAVAHRVLSKEPLRLSGHRPRLSRDLEAVVRRAMEREPKDRYPTMLSFADDLRRILDLEPTEARPISTVGFAWRRARRHPRVAALLAVACVAIAWGTWSMLLVEEKRALGGELTKLLPSVEPENRRPFEELAAELRRSLDPHELPTPIYPRGLVRGIPEHFAWTSYGTSSSDAPSIQFHYSFSVRILHGDQLIASWPFEQTDSTSCVSSPPTSLELDVGAVYRWEAVLVDAGAHVKPGSSPPSIDLTHFNLPALEQGGQVVAIGAEFSIPPSTGDEDQFAALDLEAQIEWLLKRGYAAEALGVLDAEASLDKPRLAASRRQALVIEAATILDDASRLRTARTPYLHEAK